MRYLQDLFGDGYNEADATVYAQAVADAVQPLFNFDKTAHENVLNQQKMFSTVDGINSNASLLEASNLQPPKVLTPQQAGVPSLGQGIGSALTSGASAFLATGGNPWAAGAAVLGSGIGSIVSAIKGNNLIKEEKEGYANALKARGYGLQAAGQQIQENNIANAYKHNNIAAQGGKLDLATSASILGLDPQLFASMITSSKQEYPYGGQMPLSGDFSNGVKKINVGGTHEENPNGGVPQGIAPDGQPNLVEQGELIWNDYVFSNRLVVPEDFKKQYKMGGSISTFADAADFFQRESEDRPNDMISARTKDNNLAILQELQEQVKADNEMQEAQQMWDNLTPEEQAGVVEQGLAMQGQPAPEEMLQEEQLMQEPTEEDIDMRQSQVAQPYNQMFAKGGPVDLVELNDATEVYRIPYLKSIFDRVSGFSPDGYSRAGLGVYRTNVEPADQITGPFPSGYYHREMDKTYAPIDLPIRITEHQKDSIISNNIKKRRQLDRDEAIRNSINNNSFAKGGHIYSGTDDQTLTEPLLRAYLGINPFTPSDMLLNNMQMYVPKGQKDPTIPKKIEMPDGLKRAANNAVYNTYLDNNKSGGLFSSPAVAGSIIQVVSDALGLSNRNDYSNADTIDQAARNIRNVGVSPYVNYARYEPYDYNWQNALWASQARAAQDAINANASGNRSAANIGTLANTYNYITKAGENAAKLRQAAWQEYMDVLTRNNGWAGDYAKLAYTADAANQAADIQRANYYANAAKLRQDIFNANDEAIAHNFSQLFGNAELVKWNEFYGNVLANNPYYAYSLGRDGLFSLKSRG